MCLGRLLEGVRLRLAGEMMVEVARDEIVVELGAEVSQTGAARRGEMMKVEVAQAILARRRSLQTPVVSANTQP